MERNISNMIRKSIEALVIEHTSYIFTLDKLKRRVSDTFTGFLPCFEMLIGPSRCGKTEVLKAIELDYPETQKDGRRQVPLLLVYIKSGMGPKDLPTEVIKALGVPVPSGNIRAGQLNTHMLRQLELAGVQQTLFDEASHLVDIGTHIPPQAASDWFKDLQAASKVGIVLTGVPRLKRLLDCNPQHRNRAHKPLLLMPYRWDDALQRKSFGACVSAFLNEFKVHGCEPQLPFNEFGDCSAATRKAG